MEESTKKNPIKALAEPYENFSGFQKQSDYLDILPQFREFYIEKKLENLKCSNIELINEFNRKIAPVKFHPYLDQYRRFRKNWDVAVNSKILEGKANLKSVIEMDSAIQMRNSDGVKRRPAYDEIEEGSRTLAGELINDGLNVLKDTQLNEEEMGVKEKSEARKYVLGVFQHITRMSQGKEALELKKNAEKREQATFLMDLLKQGQSGKVDKDDLKLLKDSLLNGRNNELRTEQNTVSS